MIPPPVAMTPNRSMEVHTAHAIGMIVAPVEFSRDDDRRHNDPSPRSAWPPLAVLASGSPRPGRTARPYDPPPCPWRSTLRGCSRYNSRLITRCPPDGAASVVTTPLRTRFTRGDNRRCRCGQNPEERSQNDTTDKLHYRTPIEWCCRAILPLTLMMGSTISGQSKRETSGFTNPVFIFTLSRLVFIHEL